MKQARALGVGVVIASQNPMDIDYRALGNAGVWCVGRLQTDADRERVVEGLAAATSAQHPSGRPARGSSTERTISDVVKRLAPRWFVLRDVHAGESAILLQPRWAMSFLRGPMTRQELASAREAANVATAPASPERAAPAPITGTREPRPGSTTSNASDAG